MGLAIPVGQLADRVGRVPVLLAGFALLFIVYGALLMSSLGYGLLVLCLLGLGGYFAATEGVLTAIAGAAPAGEPAGERDRHADHRGQHRQPALLARLRRPLARARTAQRGARLRRRARSGDSSSRRRCCYARSGPPCMGSRNGKILVALVVLCVVGGGAYVAVAALGPSQTTTDARPQAGAVLAQADLMVRAVDPKQPTSNGRVFEVDDGKVKPRPGDLACERVYYAAGHGICMGVAPSGVDYTATVFDSKMQALNTIPLSGLPSRARVSEDGRYGAMTVFVTGDSYLESSTAFSTRTYVVDMASGKAVDQLEQFGVTQGRQALRRGRLQLLGDHLRPTDSNRFYATLGTGDHHYLVEGNIARARDEGPARRGRVPLALARRQADRLQEPDRPQQPLAPAGARRGHAEGPPGGREPTRSTTRPSGSTTTPWPTPTAPTSTPCRPTAAANRALLVRDASSPVRLAEPGSQPTRGARAAGGRGPRSPGGGRRPAAGGGAAAPRRGRSASSPARAVDLERLPGATGRVSSPWRWASSTGDAAAFAGRGARPGGQLDA